MCDNYAVLGSTGRLNDTNTELHFQYIPDKETFSYHDIPDTIFQISNTGPWNKLIRRELLERYQLRFQLGVPILDDVYFVSLLLILAGKISIIKERLIFYRMRRPGSQTTRIEKCKDVIFLVFDALNKKLKAQDCYEKIKKSLQNATLAIMAWWLYSITDYQAYSDMFKLYSDEYFAKLGLLKMDLNNIYAENIEFYNSIINKDVRPPLNVVLESILVPGSSIVIYGAGLVGNNIYNLIKEHGKHTIKLWCDQNAMNLGNSKVCLPERLLECDFDALFIAIGKPQVVEEVKEYLKQLGINEQKVYQV